MKRCGVCGSTKINLTDVRGRKFAWKDYPAVKLQFELILPVCSECDNVMLRSSDVSKLDAAIVKTIQLDVKNAISFLTADLGISQEELSIALGITPQYLSTVKSEKKRLSFTAFNLLMLFKDYPSEIEKRTGVVVPNLGNVFEQECMSGPLKYHSILQEIWSKPNLIKKVEFPRGFDVQEVDPHDEVLDERLRLPMMRLTARGTYGKI